MQVDQRIIADDRAFILLDKTYTAHVRCECVHFIDAPGCDKGVVEASQIKQFEFVRRRIVVFGIFNIDTADVIASRDEITGQMVPDEPPGPCYQYSFTLLH